MNMPKTMLEAEKATTDTLVYHPGHITGIAFADGSGYHPYFKSSNGTFEGWVLCSEGNFEVAKIAYSENKLVAAFINSHNAGSNTVLGQLFIYP